MAMIAPFKYFRCLLLAAVLYAPLLYGQSTDRNLVLERTYKTGTTSVSGNVKDATQQVTYIDGLGRTVQAVNAQSSPKINANTPEDLVVHTEYDGLGRPFKQYAPYPVAGNGIYQSGAASAAVSYYNNSANFCQNNDRGYVLNEYEPVEGERIKKQYLAGSDKAIEYTYGGNAGSDVKRYTVSGSGVSNPDNYGAGQLSWIQTKDENGSRTREYKDKNGRVVLRRTYLSDDDSNKLDTYYVYDDFSQLRFVLQPKYQENANLDLYAFKYQYNAKGLISSKYVPAGGTTSMIYDERDRLKESTDGRGKTVYSKYDDLNRVTERGEKVGSVETMLSRLHYDTYSPSFGGNEPFTGAGGDYPGSYRTNVKGKQTVSATRVLNADGTYGSWLYATTYYDDRFNPIQTTRSLFDIGGTAKERTSNLRRFDGRIEKEIILQQTGSGDYSVEKIYSYDQSDRQLSSRYIVKKGTDVKKDVFLSASRYNSIGQLKNKYLHSSDGSSTFLEKLDYCYTPRIFLSKVIGSSSSGENFGVELKYANPSSGTTAQFNGNIAEMLWKRGASWVGYKFTYDKANRMTNGAASSNNYSETITGYDKNGNITGLQRVANGVPIDNLSYDFGSNGNQLVKVTDAENNANGFNNGSSGTSVDYAYDGNGNLTQDLNRGIAAGGLRYNIGNLVREVVIGSYTLQYHYDANGSKLRMSNSNGAVNTKYAGSFEYNQGNYLTRIATEEGQVNISNNGNDFTLNYYLTDHLGNVRQVINETGTILQETEYFPFGLEILRIAGSNNYTFLGREKQPETGYLDLKKRFYDPATGRFVQVDPVTKSQEQLTVYQYSWNNPIRYSDPNGDCPICDDFKKLLNTTKNYLTKNVSVYGKSSVEITAGSRVALKIGEGIGGDMNTASVRLIKGEASYDTKEKGKASLDYVTKPDGKGRKTMTISHGVDYAAGVGGSAKMEYQLNSSGKASGEGSSEVQVAAALPFSTLAIYGKYETDKLTGQSSVQVGLNSSYKAGAGVVIDANFFDLGMKFRIPQSKEP